MRTEDLRDLREKYVRMRRLRELHDRARQDPTFFEPDPRGAMQELASTWPGALRELDDLPLDVLRDRLDDIDGMLSEITAPTAVTSPLSGSRATLPTWMHAQIRFHGLARGALAAKRWLAGRRHVDEAVLQAFVEEIRVHPHATDALPWKNHLASIARPTRGRLMDVVFERLAGELDTDALEARRRVFPDVRACR